MGTKIIKWSEFLAESSRCKSKIWPVGSEFLYDSGELPAGLTSSGVHENDILNLQKHRGLTAAQVPGNAADWLITYCSVPAQEPGSPVDINGLEGTIMNIINSVTILVPISRIEILGNSYISDSGIETSRTYSVAFCNIPKNCKKIKFKAQKLPSNYNSRIGYFRGYELLSAIRFVTGSTSATTDYELPIPDDADKIGVTYTEDFNASMFGFTAILDLPSTITNLAHDTEHLQILSDELFQRINLPQEADPGNYRFVCHKEDNGVTAYKWVKE